MAHRNSVIYSRPTVASFSLRRTVLDDEFLNVIYVQLMLL